MEYVAYYRVSTDKQGRSGLGLEAQRDAVKRFIREGDRILVDFTEVESGKVRARPQLAAALDACRRRRATLLIAKLDRLSRNVRFIAELLESDVQITAVDMPNADRFMLHVMAAVAEHEAKMISKRTRDALKAKKDKALKEKKAFKHGGFRGYVPSAQDREKAKLRQRELAAQRAASVLPTIRTLQDEGITSPAAMAKALNARGITTARGGSWQTVQVQRLLQAAT